MKDEKIREEINAKDKGDAKSVSVDVVVCIKNHPALRAPLLTKEGSLGRGVPAVCIRVRAAGCPYNWGWFLLTTKAAYRRR